MIQKEFIKCDLAPCLTAIARKRIFRVVSQHLFDGNGAADRVDESDQSLVNRALLLDWQMFEQDLEPGVRHLCPQCWKKTVLDAIGG